MEQHLAFMADWLLAHLPLFVVATFVCLTLIELTGTSFGHGTDVSFGRLATNFGMSAMTAGLSLLVPLSSVASAIAAEQTGFGLFQVLHVSWWVVLIAALLTRTFANYWLHRAFHSVPLLWRLHQVHHSDTHFDVTLALRTHPLDYVIRIAVFASLTYLLGLPVWAVVIVDLFLGAANFWEHVDAKLPDGVDRVLGAMLATPNIHQIHHSAWQPQTDSNYGAGLIIWDRLFGTFRAPQENAVARIGLGDEHDAQAQNIWQQLALPFGTSTRRPGSTPRSVR